MAEYKRSNDAYGQYMVEKVGFMYMIGYKPEEIAKYIKQPLDKVNAFINRYNAVISNKNQK